MEQRTSYRRAAGLIAVAVLVAGVVQAATSGLVVITATVPVQCSIAVTPAAGASIADLTLGATNLKVASVNEACNAPDGYSVNITGTHSGTYTGKFVDSVSGAIRTCKGSDSLGYGVYTTTAKTYPMLPAASAGANNVVAGTFGYIIGLLQSRTHAFAWVLPAGEVAPYAAGAYYSDPSVALELYEGTVTGAKTLVDSKTITFRTKVVSSVDVSIAGSGGVFAIGSVNYPLAFGTATSGAVRDFDMVVRSTDGYRLAIKSDNRQVLKHTVVSATIPYTIKVNGSAVDLTSGAAVNVANASVATAGTGTNVPVRVTLGTLSGNEVAGTYGDTLTVTVSAY